MLDKELSVVIPAYKEAENLKVILPRINAVLRSLNINSEVLVVDTCEPMDEARTVCEEYSAIYFNREGAGNYYGDAIKTAIKKVRGSYVIFMDADGSHDPEFIDILYDNREGYDIVAASRYVAGGDNDNGALSIFMSRLVNIIYSLVLDIKCHDISNSFKLYRAADLKALNLQCENFDIIEEMVYKIKKNNDGLKIKELPFLFKKRMFGNTKRNLLVFTMSYMRTLIKLRFRK